MANQKLTDQKYESIMAHVLDPGHSPLPVELQEQYNRVLQAARLLDRHPDTSQIVAKLQAKYNIGRNTAYLDIRYARQLFVMNNPADFDFWKAWQIKDILELIRECKLKGNLKEWNKAHLVLKTVLGEKPEAEEDPRRIEKNNIFIQLNNNGTTVNLSPGLLAKLTKQEIRELTEAVYTDISEDEANNLINS